jgi:predicted lactoylglutathione lyase
MEPRVSLITLGVADLVRAWAFYEQLGFKASSAGGRCGVPAGRANDALFVGPR